MAYLTIPRDQVKHIYAPELEPGINDSLYQMKGLESVFVTDFGELKKRVEFDFGVRCVKMFDISRTQRKKTIGFSIAFSRLGLVSEESFSSLFRTEAGLVIPFLKDDGSSTFSADNERFPGVRFNVPISSR